MRIALLVLSFFAATWASAGLLVSGETPDLILIPIALSLALVFYGWRGQHTLRPRSANAGKILGLWSAVEGLALFVTAIVLQKLDRDDLMFPAMAMIVGLHFFPLARGIPAPSYYATGGALVFAGLIGFILPPAERAIVVGMCAALILWATSLRLILLSRQVETSSSPSKGSLS